MEEWMNSRCFSEAYRLTPSTLRYYIKLGLLLPTRRNNRYFFDKSCAEDMALINQLKALGFRLGDIGIVLAQIRIYKASGNGKWKKILEIIDKYQTELVLEKQRLAARQLALTEFQQKIVRQQAPKPLTDNAVSPSGVDVAFIPYLCCPNCGKMLQILPDGIWEGQIMLGKLQCGCDYACSIHNGILCVPNLFPTKSEHHYDHWCYQNLMDHEINSIFKVYNWMFTQIDWKALKGKLILENFINNYFFLYHNAHRLDPTAFYVVADESLEVVQYYKERLDAMALPLHILYIAGDNLRLPLRQGCIDLYLDSFKTSSFPHYVPDTFLLSILKKYFNIGAMVAGSFTVIKRRRFIADGGQYYQLNWLRRQLQQQGFLLLREALDEPMTTSSLIIHQDGDVLQHNSYVAQYRE